MNDDRPRELPGVLQMSRRISRRTFGIVGAAALASINGVEGACAERVDEGRGVRPPQFPEGFVWGVATAAYQIEGSADGRRQGQVDLGHLFAHSRERSGTAIPATSPTITTVSISQDVALMKEIGAKAYRFSISWPRIFPDGTGAANPKGIDFYNRLVDELLEAGIEPFATLYHWDLPQALQDEAWRLAIARNGEGISATIRATVAGI